VEKACNGFFALNHCNASRCVAYHSNAIRNPAVEPKKVYIVRLSEEERATCLGIVKKLKGTSTKVRRANILLKADADGPHWKDQEIADTFFCTRQCVENVRKRLVTEGFDIALHGKKRDTPPRRKILDGEQEAKVIALRLSEPPKGRNGWTLRLLAEKVVELEIVPAVSHVTIQKTLKKTKSRTEKCSIWAKKNKTLSAKSERRICCKNGGGPGYLWTSV
jgi:hypothetical protein